MRRVLVAAAALGLILAAGATAQSPPAVNEAAIMAERPAQALSQYRLFRDAAAREPNARVTPYDLNTPLWSDGALKFRYVYIPPGAQAQYREDGVFAFPIGTVLIKTFAFPADLRRTDEAVRFLETRLLIRRAEGWIALPYVWNDDQTEARLAPIGALLPVSFADADGARVSLEWEVPNRVEKEITIPLEYLGAVKDPWGNEKAGFPASLTLNRKDYGIVWNKALDTGNLILGDEVQVTINLEAVKSKSQESK